MSYNIFQTFNIGDFVSLSQLLQSFVAMSSLTGGGAGSLDGLVTANGAIPTGSVREVLSGSAGAGTLAISEWVLVAGTEEEDGLYIVRPDDYNELTNAVIWVRVG